MQVALAWLLRRAPNILLIPGTSSVAHMRENLAAAECVLPDDAIKELDSWRVSGPPDGVPVNVIPRGARVDNRAPRI
jgi:aryl-alcohol dehydrogenase-like predicted oxidoreductase